MKLRQLALLLLFIYMHIALVSGPSAETADGAASGGIDFSHTVRKNPDCPPPPPTKNCTRNCTCDPEVFCTPSAEMSHPIPWVSCFISSLVSLVPIKRVWKLGPHDQGDKKTLFWWFLVFNFSEKILWNGYTMFCELGDSIRVASVLGGLISAVLLGKAFCSLPRSGDMRWYSIFPAAILPTVLVYALHDNLDLLGWCCLGVTVTSHFFRIGATDYTNFNGVLFYTSLVGTFGGFLWLLHPDLCVAKHYKITSYVVSCLRGLEVFLWCAPVVARTLAKLENRSRED